MLPEDCEHRWDTDEEVRLCGRCGQVRTFPKGDEEQPRVVWPGQGAELDPTQLPNGDKELIARVAKSRVAEGLNLNQLAKLTGINMFLLRGWVGGLSLGKKAEPTVQEQAPAAPAPGAAQKVPARPKKRSQLGRYYEQNKELVIADYESMTLLEFYRKWHLSSISWARLRTLWGVPKKGRGGKARVPEPATRKDPPRTPKSEDKQMADLLKEVEYLRGYQQAVRDIFGESAAGLNGR